MCWFPQGASHLACPPSVGAVAAGAIFSLALATTVSSAQPTMASSHPWPMSPLSISGRVLGPAGVIAGARVTAYARRSYEEPPREWSAGGQESVGTDGRATFDALALGRYRISARSSECEEIEPVLADVVPGSETVDLRLECGGGDPIPRSRSRSRCRRSWASSATPPPAIRCRACWSWRTRLGAMTTRARRWRARRRTGPSCSRTWSRASGLGLEPGRRDLELVDQGRAAYLVGVTLDGSGPKPVTLMVRARGDR